MESLSGMLIPIGTILLVVLLQISFWLPAESKPQKATTVSKSKIETKPPTEDPEKSTISKRITAQDLSKADNLHCVFIPPGTISKEPTQIKKDNTTPITTEEPDRMIWKCACELGFLPAGMLKTFGNAEAMMRLGVGQCYHKK